MRDFIDRVSRNTAEPVRRESLKFVMDGTTGLLNAVDLTPMAMTGGVANSFAATSNFRTLLGSSAPVIAAACTNLEAAADAIFTPWASVTWAATGTGAIAADTDGEYGSSSMLMTCGATATDGASLANVATAGQPYTCSCRVKAHNAAAVGKHLQLTYDTTASAALELTTSWKTLVVSDASASGTGPTCTVLFTDGVAGDEVLVSAWQREKTATQTPFALPGATPSRTASKMTIPTPFAAGNAISLLFVVNTVWSAAASLVATNLFDTYTSADSGNGVRVRAYQTYVEVMNYRQGATKEKQLAINGTNWAAGANHIVIATLDAANTQQIFLDGVAGATVVGTAARETTNGDSYIGTAFNGSAQFNGSILCAIEVGRVWTPQEIAYYSKALAWFPQFPVMVN